MEGEEPASAEIHRRESERGLLDADLDEDEDAGLEDGLATPPLQHSPSWSLPRSRINSYKVTECRSLVYTVNSTFTLFLFPAPAEWLLSGGTHRLPANDPQPSGHHPAGVKETRILTNSLKRYHLK